MSFINSQTFSAGTGLIGSLIDGSELTRRFFDLGPGRAQRLLTELIAEAAMERRLVVEAADRAADELTGLWLGFVNLAVKLGVRQPLSHQEIEARVVLGIAIFLAIYEPDDSTI